MNRPAFATTDFHRLPEELRRSLRDVEQAYGRQFGLWMKDLAWSCLNACSEETAATVVSELLDRHFDPVKPVVATLAAGRRLLIVPLADAAGITGAAVTFVELDEVLLQQYVATGWQLRDHTSRLEQTSQQLWAYADHVSHDSEQICWLQSLADNIEVCDPRRGLEHVSGIVLPGLRDLLGAEEIVLFAIEDTAAVTVSVSSPVRCVCRIGDSGVSEEQCREIIDSLGLAAKVQPAVCNASVQSGFQPPAGRPRSLLLVPVETNDYQYGWLLALNKESHRDERSSGATALEPRPSEQEFGTIEGSLLKSAGILLATHARNAQLFLQKEAMMIGVIRALINAIDAKDSYTLGHSDRVALMAKRLARQLGHDEAACERTFLTGLLHDIGKIGVPDSVLLKPGKLTDEEFELIKKHPDIGYNILKHVDQLDYVLDGVLHHHEAFDGSGYPHQLAGEEIPLVARIIAVADAYDAMTSCRPYRKAMPKEKAEFILRQNAGRMWDARVVAAFDQATDDIHAICQSERAARGLSDADAQQSLHDVVRASSDLVGKAVAASHQFHRAPATSPASN